MDVKIIKRIVPEGLVFNALIPITDIADKDAFIEAVREESVSHGEDFFETTVHYMREGFRTKEIPGKIILQVLYTGDTEWCKAKITTDAQNTLNQLAQLAKKIG